MQRNFLAKEKLQDLITSLVESGYRVIGPMLKEGAIVYDECMQVSELTYNIQDEQKPGRYTIRQSGSQHYFSWSNGPQALKPLSFAPSEKLWSVNNNPEGTLNFKEAEPEVVPTAVIGVKACDLAALALHDHHFLSTDYKDYYYKKRSEKLFLIAVNCTHPAETCFCVSTGDGPRASNGYDIVLTEMNDGFVIEAGSEIGETIVKKLPCVIATDAQLENESKLIRNAAKQQTRQLPAKNLHSLLPQLASSEIWQEIGSRCLACGNCTAVCPSCFCHSEKDIPSLDGSSSEHFRQWDSCFNHDHSYIHGIVIRPEASSKYRQWLTHKFSSWIDQYGRSGCVGCGRCISWCPVGIDVTVELQRLSEVELENE